MEIHHLITLTYSEKRVEHKQISTQITLKQKYRFDIALLDYTMLRGIIE